MTETPCMSASSSFDTILHSTMDLLAKLLLQANKVFISPYSVVDHIHLPNFPLAFNSLHLSLFFLLFYYFIGLAGFEQWLLSSSTITSNNEGTFRHCPTSNNFYIDSKTLVKADRGTVKTDQSTTSSTVYRPSFAINVNVVIYAISMPLLLVIVSVVLVVVVVVHYYVYCLCYCCLLLSLKSANSFDCQ